MFCILVHLYSVVKQFTLHIEKLFDKISVVLNSNLTFFFTVKHAEWNVIFLILCPIMNYILVNKVILNFNVVKSWPTNNVENPLPYETLTDWPYHLSEAIQPYFILFILLLLKFHLVVIQLN